MDAASRDPDERPPRSASSGGRLLRVSASCPRCGSRPALRITPEAAEAARGKPPDTRLGTFQCQRKKCGEIYDLTARAYQMAS